MSQKSNREIARELEQMVQEWLLQQEAVTYPRKRGRQFRFDAIVINPVPVAIEVLIPSTLPVQPYHRYKRLLTRRIQLAQEFGPYIPLIAVVPSESSTESIVFIDRVFGVDELPNIEALPEIVHLDPITQTILAEGDPGDVDYTSQDDFEFLWSKSLNIQKLIDAETFPEHTMAGRILQDMKEEPQDISTARQLSLFTVEPSEIETKKSKRQEPEDLRRQRQRMRVNFHRAIDRQLEWLLSEKLGAVKDTIRVPLVDEKNYKEDKRLPSFREEIWVLSNGRNVVIRRLEAERMMAVVRSFEFGADAWIMRSLAPIPIHDMIVLLGSDLNLSDEEQNEKYSRKTPIDAVTVNRFEASGWKVFPWDFANDVPAFLEYLMQEVGS